MKLALVSSGLGNVLRGFETSTARWYEALRTNTDWDLRLFSGGSYESSTTVPNIPRDSWLLKPLLNLPLLSEQHRWELTYGIEQITFSAGLLRELMRYAPDIVWVKDVPLAHLVLAARDTFGLGYKVVFANGGALRPASYHTFDRIQQLHSDGYNEAKEWGIPEERMDLVTNCVISREMETTRDPELRASLGISETDYVIACTAAWNRYHKRIDYLIEEVAALNDENVKLILLGVPEADTDFLKNLGNRLLGDRIHWMTVAPSEVPRILRISDLFVLPSLNEGLGNALIEAAMAELPIICHPHGGANFILNDDFWMTDLSEPNALVSKIMLFRKCPPPRDRIIKLKENVSQRFSDRTLVGKFEQMVVKTLRTKTDS